MTNCRYPLRTNCVPLVTVLVLLFYERVYILSVSDNNQSDVIGAFDSTLRYLDDLLTIDTHYFEQI